MHEDLAILRANPTLYAYNPLEPICRKQRTVYSNDADCMKYLWTTDEVFCSYIKKVFVVTMPVRGYSNNNKFANDDDEGYDDDIPGEAPVKQPQHNGNHAKLKHNPAVHTQRDACNCFVAVQRTMT